MPGEDRRKKRVSVNENVSQQKPRKEQRQHFRIWVFGH